MGITNYFKKKPAQHEARAETQEMSEKPQIRTPSFETTSSSSASFKQPARGAVNGFRLELLINNIYQQQCQRLWVGDASGETEGILVRKSMGQYLGVPSALESSPLAAACASLNVQVRDMLFSRFAFFKS